MLTMFSHHTAGNVYTLAHTMSACQNGVESRKSLNHVYTRRGRSQKNHFDHFVCLGDVWPKNWMWMVWKCFEERYLRPLPCKHKDTRIIREATLPPLGATRSEKKNVEIHKISWFFLESEVLCKLKSRNSSICWLAWWTIWNVFVEFGFISLSNSCAIQRKTQVSLKFGCKKLWFLSLYMIKLRGSSFDRYESFCGSRTSPANICCVTKFFFCV